MVYRSNVIGGRTAIRPSPTQLSVHDLEAVTREAEQNGLAFAEVVPMPANNLSVVFARRA